MAGPHLHAQRGQLEWIGGPVVKLAGILPQHKHSTSLHHTCIASAPHRLWLLVRRRLAVMLRCGRLVALLGRSRR